MHNGHVRFTLSSFHPIYADICLAFTGICYALLTELCYAPFTVMEGCEATPSVMIGAGHRLDGALSRGATAARLSGGRGIAIRGPAIGPAAGLGLSTGELPFPVIVIPTRIVVRLTPAKTSVAFSTQRITTSFHMLSLLGGDRLSESVAVLYRDGTVLSADRRAIATCARKQQERGHGASSSSMPNSARTSRDGGHVSLCRP